MRYLVVDQDNDGRRIDNFLHSELPRVPRERVYRLLRRGEVRVDGARARAGRRLRAGEAIRIPPLLNDPDGTRANRGVRRGPTPDGRRIEAAILYEDERLLVLSKPSGLAVHGGSGVAFGVIELLRAARPNAPYLELGHRLDRDTSGCLIVAKRRSSLRALHDALRRCALEKRYAALLGGNWNGATRRVNLPLARRHHVGGERMVRVTRDGRESVTEVAALADGAGVVLVEARPRTGRTHQIRVHCAAIGHPVAGDEKYGDRELNLRVKSSGLRRLFLHAASVCISGPGLPEVTVRSALDPVLVDAARRLEVPEEAFTRFQPGPG